MNNFLKNRESLGQKKNAFEINSTDTPPLTSMTQSQENINLEKKSVSQNDPVIELLLKDGIVKKIIVQCSCGKCTEIACEY